VLTALVSGESLSNIFNKLKTPPERTVGFTIAVIALSAKMAKADGYVTQSEILAFKEIFRVPVSDEANAERLFDLARQDIAGFEIYARKIKKMFGTQTDTLEDLLEGLFYIAVADGRYHDQEDAYLKRVSEIFVLGDLSFRVIKARYVKGTPANPYEVLGVSPSASITEIRNAWRDLVKKNHPDKLTARGVPIEAVKLGEARLVAINQAWNKINNSTENSLA
jgi:DnaJ like chaperone protein